MSGLTALPFTYCRGGCPYSMRRLPQYSSLVLLRGILSSLWTYLASIGHLRVLAFTLSLNFKPFHFFSFRVFLCLQYLSSTTVNSKSPPGCVGPVAWTAGRDGVRGDGERPARNQCDAPPSSAGAAGSKGTYGVHEG